MLKISNKLLKISYRLFMKKKKVPLLICENCSGLLLRFFPPFSKFTSDTQL